jgi:Putative DNA-binding domain
MELHELQRRFQARVLAGEHGVEAELLPDEADELAVRVGVYADGYASRLVEALGATYPALSKTVGDEEFERLIREFIATGPSTYYSVRNYGGQLGAHLERSAGARARVLGQLARFEWMIAEVFDAADDAPASVEELTRIPAASWGDVRFGLRASLRRFATQTNAVDWWRAANELRPAPADFEASPPTVEWVLWRAGLATRFRSLSAVETAALDAARGGASFSAVCEVVAAIVGEEAAAIQAASLLRGWLAEELVASITVSSHAE